MSMHGQFKMPAATKSPKPRRVPLLIVLAFVTAAVAFFTRNHGGIVGIFSSPSSSSPQQMPSWMSKPFDKQAPLTHTVHPYAEPAHDCCKKGSVKCLTVPQIPYFLNQLLLLQYTAPSPSVLAAPFCLKFHPGAARCSRAGCGRCAQCRRCHAPASFQRAWQCQGDSVLDLTSPESA
jgi:hypothetical protein